MKDHQATGKKPGMRLAPTLWAMMWLFMGLALILIWAGVGGTVAIVGPSDLVFPGTFFWCLLGIGAALVVCLVVLARRLDRIMKKLVEE